MGLAEASKFHPPLLAVTVYCFIRHQHSRKWTGRLAVKDHTWNATPPPPELDGHQGRAQMPPMPSMVLLQDTITS